MRKLIVGDAALGVPLAYCHFSPIGDGYDLIYIYVSPGYRRAGIAKKLIENFIKKVKPKSIMLEVRHSNIPAINLYKSLGLQIISERKGYYLNSEDANVMKWSRL